MASFFRNGENICYVFLRCCVIVVRIGTESTHSETVFLLMKDFLSTDCTQVHLVVLFDVISKYLNDKTNVTISFCINSHLS